MRRGHTIPRLGAVALGSCILAAAAYGVHESVQAAADAMVHEKAVVEPRSGEQ